MRSIGKVQKQENVLRRNESSHNHLQRFSPYGKRILNAAKLVYEDSIQNAAKEAICENEGNKKYSSSCRWDMAEAWLHILEWCDYCDQH
ncbi:hypothetical protein TNCV_4942841 [Trichonephila clavipes]|nr:hypothetical protein TNCV_4942841 [Trichonephila clavipes]